MWASHRNALSIAKLICIKFNFAVALLAKANNQTRLDKGRFFVWPAALWRGAVCAATVQVDQNVARFLAVAGADDPAVLEFIHDAGGTTVAEAQAVLEERDAGLLLAANDLDAILNDFFVLVDAALVIEAAAGAGKLPVDLEFVVGSRLLGDEVNNALDFLVGYMRALCPDQPFRTTRQKQHIALA
jgi:hypothetical protein